MYIVYGGSFNPPTKAHFNIVSNLLKKYSNSKVILLPVGNKYEKDELIPFNNRKEMLEILFKDMDVLVSSLENNNKFLGTLDSLKKLEQTYGKLKFVLGSDNIYTLDKWINYKQLIKDYEFIIIKRDNDNIDEIMSKYNNLNPKYEFINLDEKGSSSLVRENINENKDLITEEIYNYIINNKLYESSDNNV